jgi:uncharacterized protein (DUF58 family)
MTGRAWTVSALACGLVFLGLLARNGSVLLLALPLLVYLGAAVLSMPEEIRVKVERSVSGDRITYGKEVHVKLIAENQGATFEELHLEDGLSPGLRVVAGDPGRSLSLPTGGRVEIDYTVRGGRGAYQLEDVNMVANDDFCMFRVQRTVRIPSNLVIYPQVARLRRIDIRPRRTHGFTGPIPSRKGGAGMDFFGVREYQMGDALRRINWRITARNDQALFTNQYEQESIADVGLILDARRASDIRNHHGTLFDRGVHAAASLAELFLAEGHRVGLLIYGYGLIRVFPGYGAVQRERILKTLARAHTGMNYAMESLESLPTRLFPARSQLVVVGPVLPEDLAALLRMRSQGYAMLVVSPDPIEFEVRGYAPAPDLDAPLRLARVERAVVLRRMRRAGIRVVDWQTDQPLDQTLYTALARQPTQRPFMEMERVR